MSTLGKHWKLHPKVRALRAEKITAIWMAKSSKEKAAIRLKRLPGLRAAHKKQALSGNTPETNPYIRRKISSSMKELRKTQPPHNKDKYGYTNSGSWKIGSTSWNLGKKQSQSTRKKLAEKAPSSSQRRKWIADHNIAVEALARRLRNRGLKVWTCFGDIPDLIIRRDKQLVAIEMTAKAEQSYRACKRVKHKDGFFDVIEWVDLKGKLRT